MESRLVVGVGVAIGRLVARRLVERGDDVQAASRSGTIVDGARTVVLDAADAAAVSAAAEGVSTIFLRRYRPARTWPRAWPPIAASVIAAARGQHADLVMMGNLYPYGPVTEPMTEHTPELTTERKGLVRRQVWASALEAHRRGELRAVEVRASDYFGPDAGDSSQLGTRFFGPLLAGRRAWVIGDPDQEHSGATFPTSRRP